jgi:hypothetical protein
MPIRRALPGRCLMLAAATALAQEGFPLFTTDFTARWLALRPFQP